MKAGESHSVPTVHFADPPASCVSEKSEKSEVLAKVSQVHEKPLKGPPIASICKLFSLVDFKESLILLLGLLGAIGNGVTQPVVLVVFGDLIDGMGSSSVPVELPANVTPEQMALLMDDAMDGMMSEMERLCIIMCLIGVANTVAATLQGACFKIFSDMQTKKYRVLYFKSVLFQDVSWFDLKEVAALPSEINDDLEKIGDALGDKLGNGIMSFSAFVGGFGCAFGLGWLVALVMCAMLPFMGVGAAVMGKAVQEIQLESQSWYSKAACVVEECLYAMRTVVAFGGERRELQKFQFALVQTRRGGIRNGFKIGLGLGYTTMIIFAGNALAFWFGMTLRYNDQVNPATGRPWEPGNILAIFFCVFTGSFMIGNLDPSLKALAAARFAAGRFFQVKENRPQVQCGDVDGRKDLESIENFELREVHFSYPARPDVKILNGLSLEISRGQKVAVVGESGSGKSTVMALLERFYDPNSGLVLVNGQDMKNFKVSALRRCIGYVGQEPVLFAGSIHHNIMQGYPGASKEDFARACAEAQLGFVEALPEKYHTFVGAGGGQLSGGQKQRIAIARALVKRASFLFLDEATSALDNASEKMIQQTIDSLCGRDLGIVSIAHRLSTVRGAEKIYVLSHGALVELDAGTIEFADVKFFYPFRPAIQVLKGISFRILRGTSVGLVGPSGGGKSTVMCLLQRFYDPQEGQIYIGAERRPLKSLNIRWWRKQIGFVGQEPILFNSTVRENILYGMEKDDQVTEEHIKKCEEMCNLGFLYTDGNTGLNTEVGPRGSRLSGGQKQRVAICRALLREPKVMLLDEATSALDSQSEQLVQQALEAALANRTSFAIAHRLSTVQGCDLILVNADGRVVESGTHGELMMMKGVYYQLQMQSQK